MHSSARPGAHSDRRGHVCASRASLVAASTGGRWYQLSRCGPCEERSGGLAGPARPSPGIDPRPRRRAPRADAGTRAARGGPHGGPSRRREARPRGIRTFGAQLPKSPHELAQAGGPVMRLLIDPSPEARSGHDLRRGPAYPGTAHRTRPAPPTSAGGRSGRDGDPAPPSRRCAGAQGGVNRSVLGPRSSLRSLSRVAGTGCSPRPPI